jgi:hypothetical protein
MVLKTQRSSRVESSAMNYCSLEDAFQMAPGNEYSSRAARREERKKAKKCKGPLLTFMESQGLIDEKDPDRQHLERPRDIPAMNPNTGLTAHVPTDAPLGMEPFQNEDFPGNAGSGPGIRKQVARQDIADILPRSVLNEKQDEILATQPTTQEIKQVLSTPKPSGFFGADPSDDSFADFNPDAKNYLMEPSFASAFRSLNTGTHSSLPVPSVRDVWKPLTPSGVDTAFFNHLPPPGGEYKYTSGREAAYGDYTSMSKKMDKILSRLDELQRGPNPEQSQKEILMFVTSGVFVLFLMDLLVRKGSSMRFLKGF